SRKPGPRTLRRPRFSFFSHPTCQRTEGRGLRNRAAGACPSARRSPNLVTSPCQDRSEPPGVQPRTEEATRRKNAPDCQVQNRRLRRPPGPSRRHRRAPPGRTVQRRRFPPAPRHRSAAVDGGAYTAPLPPCQQAFSKILHMPRGSVLSATGNRGFPPFDTIAGSSSPRHGTVFLRPAGARRDSDRRSRRGTTSPAPPTRARARPSAVAGNARPHGRPISAVDRSLGAVVPVESTDDGPRDGSAR
ncbi:hypothetical protein EDD54_4589, partial [Oharaeibacter diazotrophicus]